MNEVKFINSYGQEVKVKCSDTLWKSLRKRNIVFVAEEVREVLERINKRRPNTKPNPVEIGLELGVRIGLIRKVVNRTKKG